MKLILLVFNLLLVAADKRHVEFQPRSSYHYEYSSRLMTGIPHLANQYAGYELTSDVILHATDANTVFMKMSDVQIGELHRTTSEPPEQAEIDGHKKSQMESELSKPIKFSYQDGRVENFEADSNEPNWSLNIKKSILSLFNLDLNPDKIIRSEDGSSLRSRSSDNSDNDYYGVYEDGVNGVCETVYEIRHSADPRANDRANDRQNAKNVMNVTKVRNYENCLKRATIINDNIETKGCPTLCRKNKDTESVFGYHPVPDEVENYYESDCPYGYEPSSTPTDQYTNYRYNISRGKSSSWTIECAMSEGKIVLNADGNKIVAFTTQNATLTKIVDNDKAPGQPQSGKRYTSLMFGLETSKDTDIPYSDLLTSSNQNELKATAHELVDSITKTLTSDKVSDSNLVSFKTVQLIDVFGAMSSDNLKNFFKEKAEKGRSDKASTEDKVKRQLVLDAIATSGSRSAAEAIRDLITNMDVSKREAQRVLKTLPANMMTPTRDTLNSYQKMFENNRLVDAESHSNSKRTSSLFSSLALTLAKMVKKACSHNQPEVSDVYTRHESSKNPRQSPALTIMTKADSRKDRGHSFDESNYFERNTQDNACKSSDYGKYVKWFADRFENADNLQDKLDAAKALAHLGSRQVLEIFETYVSGKVDKDKCPGYQTKDESQRIENCIFVRTAIISNLHHLSKQYPKQVKALVLPVYKDRSESEEVRMAAFSALIHTVPKPHELMSIASELRSENNRHVKSLARAVIENAANLTQPCHQPLAQAAQEALAFLPDNQDDDSNVDAKWAEYYDDDTKNGASFYYRVERTSDSSVPSSGVFKAKKLFGKMNDNILTVTFHQQGFEKYLDRPGGLQRLASEYIASILNNNSRTRAQRSSKENKREEDTNQDVSDLKQQLKIKTRHSATPKLRVYIKAFEKTSFYAYDEQDLRDFFDSLREELSQTVQEMSKGESGHYVRLFTPTAYTEITVTDNGLPVVTRVMKPIMMSIKVDDAKLSTSGQKSSHTLPTEVEFSAKIEPQVIKGEIIGLNTINEGNNRIYGAAFTRKFHLKAPMEIEAKYNEEDNSVKFKFQPQTNQEFLHYSRVPSTFISQGKQSLGKKTLDATDEKVIETMNTPFKIEKEVGQQTFGLGFKIMGETEDERYDRNIWEAKDGQTKSKAEAAIEELINRDARKKDVTVTFHKDKNVPASGYDVTVRFNRVYNQEKYKTSKNSPSGKTRAANLDKEQKHEFYSANFNEQCNGNPGRHYPNVAKEVTDSANDEDLKKHARKLLENTKDSWSWTYQNGKGKDEVNLATRTCNLAITAKSIGSKSIKMAANVMRVQSIDKRVNVMKAELSVKQPQESKNRKSSFYWIISAVTYPTGPNEFNPQTTSPQDLTTTIEANLGEGERCAQNKGIMINGVMEKVKDEVYNQGNSKVNDDQDSWYAKQCQEDTKQGQQASYACEEAAKDYAKLNKLTLDVNYDNLSPRLTNLTKKLDLALKSKYYSRMSYNGVDVNNPDKKMRIEAQYSEKGKGRPVVNLRIEKPTEEMLFKRIDSPTRDAPSTLESYRAEKNTDDQNSRCVMTTKYVRTYDNVTYQMPDSDCRYVLSMDCSSNAQFAVIVNSKKSARTVTVLVEDKKVEVQSPQDNKAQIKVDGKPEQVSEDEPKLYCTDCNCLQIYLEPSSSRSSSPTVVVKSDKKDVKVTSDGQNVKVEVGNRYTGKTCGLCGDNDNENEQEFEGPESCIYDNEKDFANSYAVPDSCQVTVDKASRKCPESNYKGA